MTSRVHRGGGGLPPEDRSRILADLWSASAKGWSLYQEQRLQPVYRQLLRLLPYKAGASLLDCGVGAGMFAHHAAEKGYRVAGVDIAEGMISIARQRTPLGDFRIADSEKLPHPDRQFDSVTSINSLQYVPAWERAVGEMQRVCKRGGALAIVVWGEEDRSDQAQVLKALKSIRTGGTFEKQTPFSLAKTPLLTGAIEHQLPVEFIYSSLEEAVNALASEFGARLTARYAGEDRTAKVIEDALARFKGSDGKYRLNNVFRCLLKIA